MSQTDDNDARIGKAFNRRKEAQQELANLRNQAIKWGNDLARISDRLLKEPEYVVEQKGGILTFRTAGATQLLVDKAISPPFYPSVDEVVGIINRMAELRQEILELDKILGR